MDLKKRTRIFISSLLITIAATRILLFFFPSANLSILSYNVHHLFTGVVLTIVSSIFLVLNIINRYTIILAAVGSGLMVDQMVYLISTDGSDLAYSSNISLLGAAMTSAIVLAITLIAYKYKKRD